jgi:hypothetical protein
MKLFMVLMIFTCSLAFGQEPTTAIRSPFMQPTAVSSLTRMPQGPPVPLFGPSSGGESDDAKSPALAVLYSFLLPGMGELYAGDYSGGKYFTILEGGLLIGLIGMDRYANWLQSDAYTYAAQHAHAGVDGKDDRYYVALGDYNDVNEYNDAMLRRRLPQNVYNNNPASSDYWKWDALPNRNHYFDMKVSSDNRFNDARFIGAAIVINHIVSAINAGRIAISHNKGLSQTSLLDVHADIVGGLANPAGVRLTFSRSF